MLPFFSNCIKKSSQIFIDPSCNILEIDEIVPKDVIQHYMKQLSIKEQAKYKNHLFYKMQDKIRNMRPLDDTDILRLYTFEEDEKIILLQLASKSIEVLLEHANL